MRIKNTIITVLAVATFLCVLLFLTLNSTTVQLWLDRLDADRVDARIAAARKVSDAAAVELLREMLREKSFSRERALTRIYRLKFPPEIAAAAAPELVTILEEDAGFTSMASEELERIGPFIPDGVVPRLVELTKHGTPDWRKTNAVLVLKSKWNWKTVDDPAVAAAIRDVEQTEWFKEGLKKGLFRTGSLGQEAPDFDPNFTVEWPGTPTESRRRFFAGTPDEKVTYLASLIIWKPTTISFYARVHEPTEQSLQQTDARELLRSESLRNIESPDLTFTEVERQGHPGVEAAGRYKDGYIRRVVVLAGRRLYQLEVSSREPDRLKADDVTKFFDSFLTKD